MDSNNTPLIKLLTECTVRIKASRGEGSGFFVGPGTILTCAHVVEGAWNTHDQVFIFYNGKEYPADIINYQAKPFPDLALLKIDLEDNVSVLLDPVVMPNDDLYGFGYQGEFLGGEGIPGKYAAPSWFDDARTQELIKFSDALVIPGFSGGPLLNLNTGAVCGVIKRTLGENAAVGGRAVPIRYAIDLFKIKPQKDSRWLEIQNQHANVGSMQNVQASKQDVLIYELPNNQYARERLFGREEITDRVNAWLDENKCILLYGLAASGKTVLAATIADNRLKSGKGKYLWLKLKPTMKDDDVLDALIRRFTTEKDREQLSSLSAEAKIQTLSTVMERSDARLWVIDDAPQGSALNVIVKIAPANMSVLITSRVNFGTGQDIDYELEVGDISPSAAMDMLVTLSRRADLRRNPSTRSLLEVLGFHPYSIEIASQQLSQPERDVAELLEMIEDAPHDLEMPGDFAEQGRESMKKLLDAVVYSLKTSTGDADKDKANAAVLLVFQAFGAFFASGATIDLLSTYLHQKTGETIRSLYDMAEISLAHPEPGTRFFDIHDLVFSYARALWKKESGGDYSASLTAIAAFLEDHKQDFKLLASEMDNLLGCAQRAQKDNSDIFLQIISGLARGGYMDNRGHTPEFLKFLDEAIRVAQSRGMQDLMHYLLSKRGNAHYDRLEFAQAESCYREALVLAPSWYREIVLNAVLGKTYTKLKNYYQADEHFRQSERIVNEHDNSEEHDDYLAGKIFILQQKIGATYVRKNYEEGKKVTLEGLALIHNIEDLSSEALFKTNLGTFEALLGSSLALELHKQVLQIAENIGDQQVLAAAYYGAAMDYLVMDEFEQARDFILKAKRLYEEYGDLERLNQLKALAQVIKEG